MKECQALRLRTKTQITQNFSRDMPRPPHILNSRIFCQKTSQNPKSSSKQSTKDSAVRKLLWTHFLVKLQLIKPNSLCFSTTLISRSSRKAHCLIWLTQLNKYHQLAKNSFSSLKGKAQTTINSASFFQSLTPKE